MEPDAKEVPRATWSTEGHASVPHLSWPLHCVGRAVVGRFRFLWTLPAKKHGNPYDAPPQQRVRLFMSVPSLCF